MVEVPKMRENYFDSKIVRAWSQLRPEPTDLDGAVDSNGRRVYSVEEIERDTAAVRRLGAKFLSREVFGSQQEDETAEKFEYACMAAFYDYGWLDDSVSVTPGSTYDDYKRQVDFVLAFNEGEQGPYTYLAVDATVAEDPYVLEKKERRILDNISQGWLTEVKYFINDDNPEIQGKMRMPHVVLALNRQRAVEFINLLSKGPSLSKEDQTQLEKFRKEILQGMEDTLNRYITTTEEMIESTYELMKKKKMQKILDDYKKALAKFQEQNR